jgi:AcrR family transcriptional regulator
MFANAEQCSKTASDLSSTLARMSTSDLPAIPRLPSRKGTASRRAPRERALSRDAIAGAALKIVDTEGLDALTMRSVAQALGTGAASLYAHVASKDQLLELVVERVIGEIPPAPEPDPDRWQEQIKETARAIRGVFSGHRDLARASFARIPLGENALAGSESMIALMRAGGLSDRVIAFACDLLPLYVMAVCYEESLYEGEVSLEEMETFVADLRTYFASLPPTRFPNVVALAGPLTAGDGEERFEFGLEVLLRGLAAMPR